MDERRREALGVSGAHHEGARRVDWAGDWYCTLQSRRRERAAALKGNGASNEPSGPFQVSSAILYFGCKKGRRGPPLPGGDGPVANGREAPAYSPSKTQGICAGFDAEEEQRRGASGGDYRRRGSVLVCGGTSMGSAARARRSARTSARLRARGDRPQRGERVPQSMHDGGNRRLPTCQAMSRWRVPCMLEARMSPERRFRHQHAPPPRHRPSSPNGPSRWS